MLDQALTSATNLVALVVVGRAVGADSFGAFAMVLAIWTALLAVARASLGEPFLIRGAALSDDEWHGDLSNSVGGAVVAGTIVGTGIAGLSLPLANSEVGNSILALSLVLPALVTQDFLRVAAFGRARADLAVLNGLAWSGSQLGALGLLWWTGNLSPAAAILSLGLGGCSGCVAGLIGLGVPLTSLRPTRLPWDSLALGRWLGGARLVQTVVSQLTLLVAALFVGLSSLGGFRAVYAVFGPLGALFRAAEIPALAALSRREEPPRRYRLLPWSLGLVALTLAYGIFISYSDGTIISALFGSDFVQFHPLVTPVLASHLIMAAGAPFGIALRTMGRAREYFFAEVVNSGLRISLALPAILTFGISGLAWAFSLASAASFVFLIGAYAHAATPVSDPRSLEQVARPRPR